MGVYEGYHGEKAQNVENIARESPGRTYRYYICSHETHLYVENSESNSHFSNALVNGLFDTSLFFVQATQLFFHLSERLLLFS